MRKLLQAIGKKFNLVVLEKEEYQEIIKKVTTEDAEPTKPTTLLTYDKIASMLTEYDNTKLELHKQTSKMKTKGCGFEDTRIHTFDFYQIKNYLAYTEKMAKEKGITLKGLSFIKGTYNKETASDPIYIGYENLMYLPTAMVNGKEKQIDLGSSSKENIVSFKDLLANHGHNWRYDTSEDTQNETEVKKEIISTTKTAQLKVAATESVVGNFGNAAPPF